MPRLKGVFMKSSPYGDIANRAIADQSDMYLKIRPDGALALALMHVIINEKLYDAEFVEKWTLGFDKLVPHVQPYIMVREQAIEPLGECRGVLDVFKGLAQRLDLEDKFPWEDEQALVRDILQPCELDFDYLTKSKPDGDFYQEKRYGSNPGDFRTPSGKIEIYSQAIADVGFDPLPTYREPDKSPQGSLWEKLGDKYPLILSTGQRWLTNTASQMHHIPWLKNNELFPKAEMGPATAKQYGISHAQSVWVETDRGQAKCGLPWMIVSQRASYWFPKAVPERKTATC